MVSKDVWKYVGLAVLVVATVVVVTMALVASPGGQGMRLCFGKEC